jgi:beta-exotoxin I transport system ATP-binding protein
MAPDAALEARALTKSYGRSRGIVEVDLRFERGEVVGLVGANGAGKTTFMRTLLDFIRPTSGSVSVLGLDSRRDSVAVRRRCTYLPGELVLPPRLTGHQVMQRFAFTRSAADLRAAPEVAERLDLDLSRKIGDLSKGNKQKVGLVLAFAPQADLLVLDEPTSGLDPLLQRTFAEMLTEAVARGATVLLSSHVMSEVEQIASRVALLRAGRLVTFSSMEKVRERSRRRGTARPLDLADLPALADALGAVPEVHEVDVSEDGVAFACEGQVDTLVKRLAGFGLASLDIGHVDLEDAFFSMYDDTGTEGSDTAESSGGAR